MSEQHSGAKSASIAMRPDAGLDRLLADRTLVARLAGVRVGLLANRTSQTAEGIDAAAALARALGSGQRGLVRLFAPEHGWSGIEAEGDVDATEPATGLPVHSLYGQRRAPDPAALADLDVILVDLQDVGVRCYTYGSTAALLLRSFARLVGKEVWVLDRSNPLGAGQAGPRLDPALRSFIGYFDLPFVHGRALGAMLRDWAAEAVPGLAVTVVAAPAKLAPPALWVPPSPSLRDWDAVRLYPGLVLLEGTNVSEGRGTAQNAFRAVLAPELDGVRLAEAINSWGCEIFAKPRQLTPTHNKFANVICDGVVLSIELKGSIRSTINEVRALQFGIRLLDWLKRNHAPFAWRRGRVMATADGEHFTPVEGFMLDYLIGDSGLRRDLDAGVAPETLVARWAS